jgi:hypothetical protein
MDIQLFQYALSFGGESFGERLTSGQKENIFYARYYLFYCVDCGAGRLPGCAPSGQIEEERTTC